MGVQGLWDVLSEAGKSRSLAHIAVVDGFEQNTSGRRAFRIGVDASIWYHHAMYNATKKGANPELRLLFFRLLAFAKLPFIPIFIFDGRERPKVKRGSKKGKSGSHALTPEFKKLLDTFGLEWRMALGEAEAELAYLNRIGVIDAVLTDDVDTLIFGANTIIRNAGLNLTGNRRKPATDLNGKISKCHVTVFTAESIRTHPDIQMTRGGLLLFALVSGGDYDDGLKNFGTQIAHCLARLGFGDQLLREYERCQGRNMDAFLTRWRADINTELHTNAHKLLRSRMPSLSVPETFPDMEVLRNYVSPVCSVTDKRPGGGSLRDNRELSIPDMVAYCEDHFDEWGYPSMLLKRFRANVWEAAVMRILRRAALEADEQEKTRRIAAGRADLAIHGPLTPSPAEEVGTPALLVKKYLSPTEVDRRAAAFVRRDDAAGAPEVVLDTNPLIRQIVRARRHVSTDKILEYSVEVDPTQFVRLAQTGIMGKHQEPQAVADHAFDDYPEFAPEDEEEDAPPSSQGASQPKKAGPKQPPPDPYSIMRMWFPASIMRQVHPRLVEDFEAAEAAQKSRKTSTAAGKRKRQDEPIDAEEGNADGRSRPAAPAHVPAPPVEDRARELPSAAARGGRTTRVEIDVYAESSLPFRQCGFDFTFPDPDSPDMLVPDEDENAHVLIDLDDDDDDDDEPQVMSQPVASSQVGTPSGSRASRSQPDPPRHRRADSAASNELNDYMSDVPDDGVRAWQERMADSGSLPKNAPARGPAAASAGVRCPSARGRNGGGRGGGDAAPRAKRPRASAPAMSASSGLDDVAAAAVNGLHAGGADAEQEPDDDVDDAPSWMDDCLLGGRRDKGKARARSRGRGRGSNRGGGAARGRSISDRSARAPARNTLSAAAAANDREASPPRARAARRSSPGPPPRARPATPPPSARGPRSIPLPSPLASRASSVEPTPSRRPQPQAPARRAEPLFLPSPSPPPPPAFAPSHARKRARSCNVDPGDVIEIDTSEDERPLLTQSVGKRRPPRRYRHAEPSSSQASRLSEGGLQRVGSIIDLT